MRILIIRHGDPDYSIDSLTEKGWREANLLSPRLLKEHITSFYVSPLGRAQDTAKPTLDLYEKETGVRPKIETLEWLREFPAHIDLDLTTVGLRRARRCFTVRGICRRSTGRVSRNSSRRSGEIIRFTWTNRAKSSRCSSV